MDILELMTGDVGDRLSDGRNPLMMIKPPLTLLASNACLADWQNYFALFM